MEKRGINIANILTVSRIIFVPFILYFILTSKNYTALILFLIALSTDAVDGYFARKQNKTTKLGKILDPISDRLLYGSVIFGVLIKDQLTIWITIYIFGTAFYILGYLYFINKKIRYPTKFGRITYFFEFIILIALLIGYVNNTLLIIFSVLLIIPPIHYLIKRPKK